MNPKTRCSLGHRQHSGARAQRSRGCPLEVPELLFDLVARGNLDRLIAAQPDNRRRIEGALVFACVPEGMYVKKRRIGLGTWGRGSLATDVSFLHLLQGSSHDTTSVWPKLVCERNGSRERGH